MKRKNMLLVATFNNVVKYWTDTLPDGSYFGDYQPSRELASRLTFETANVRLAAMNRFFKGFVKEHHLHSEVLG